MRMKISADNIFIIFDVKSISKVIAHLFVLSE